MYRSDLFNNVSGIYDIIIFNTPYLEVAEDPSYSGGTDLMIRFIEGSTRYLKSNGIIYFTAYDKNDLGLILIVGRASNLYIKIVKERRIFYETIYVLKGIYNVRDNSKI